MIRQDNHPAVILEVVYNLQNLLVALVVSAARFPQLQHQFDLVFGVFEFMVHVVTYFCSVVSLLLGAHVEDLDHLAELALVDGSDNQEVLTEHFAALELIVFLVYYHLAVFKLHVTLLFFGVVLPRNLILKTSLSAGLLRQFADIWLKLLYADILPHLALLHHFIHFFLYLGHACFFVLEKLGVMFQNQNVVGDYLFTYFDLLFQGCCTTV